MRRARTNDVWRALYKRRPLPLQSIRVTYQESETGPAINLALDGPLSLLCGENGVGKSRAMRALHGALGRGFAQADFRPSVGPAAPAVIAVSAMVRLSQEGGELGDAVELTRLDEIAAHFVDGDGGSTIHWFDPTVQIPYLLHILRHDQSLGDLWEGVKPKRLDGEALAEVSGLVGRSYSALEIYEITDYKDHAIVPYFRATSHGDTYGAEDMGLGELSLLFFFWMLGRIAPGAIFLLEEPETFIAPRSQRTLIDVTAREALEKGLFVVVTSHSGVITERVPPSHVDLVSRRGSAVTFARDPSRGMLADRLGLVPPRSLICLVEDDAAAFFARALLEAGNSKYVAHCAVYVAGSVGEISRVLEVVDHQGAPTTVLVGLYDGDVRNSIPRGLRWPVLCLPGGAAPEQVVMSFVEEYEAQLPQVLGKPSGVIAGALAAADGQNHHDWLEALCAALPMSTEELFRRVVLGITEFRPVEVSDFVAHLEGVVNR